MTDTIKAYGDIAAGYRQLLGIRVIGITGSVGKTTTKEMTACVLEKSFRTAKSMANHNNNIGLPMGLGLGRSRQKYLYLPEEHNDYIFSIVCEELGFVGALVIILLFILLIVRGYWIAMHARDRFGALTAAGITTLLAVQVFFNIGVVTNFLPATGISLPFFSYGGTALLLQLFEMGIVLSVSRQNDNKML